MREFLTAYFDGDNEAIKGRTGYIRQAFPITLKEYSFNRVALLTEGINGQLSDIDFYDATRITFEHNSYFKYDIGGSNYFRKNAYLTKLISMLGDFWRSYLMALEQFCQSIEFRFNRKGSVFPMLETIKNAMIGRMHDPHPYFIERGCHSLTLMARPNNSPADTSEKLTVANFIKVLELLLRAHDALDEQLHAGYFQYILTSTANFYDYSSFLWAFGLAIGGVSIPTILQGVTQAAKVAELKDE